MSHFSSPPLPSVPNFHYHIVVDKQESKGGWFHSNGKSLLTYSGGSALCGQSLLSRCLPPSPSLPCYPPFQSFTVTVQLRNLNQGQRSSGCINLSVHLLRLCIDYHASATESDVTKNCCFENNQEIKFNNFTHPNQTTILEQQNSKDFYILL